MPPWNPRANEIFLQVSELSSSDARRARLDEACGADTGLRGEVEELLDADQQAGSFLEAPVFGSPVPVPLISEGPGTQIGPYKLLEQIGEGGFGIVFMAEQQHPLRRKVALKVIKPGMDTREVIARFEAERQAVAMMDHPNIARVFEAGATTTGRPYFVMELVRGVPITDYCDQHRLTPRERLELFITVCHAVQHAHQKGIIHRDLKPSNVLVTQHDGRPVAKVIDFGVSKAIDQRLTERTLFTRFAQMVGTPLYMSPEQAELSGLDVDTRSDVYSLGVLLYELLTGATPFEQDLLKKAGFEELRRVIREDDPPKPSVRLSTLGESAETVSENRQTAPRRLTQLFRGELDCIVMKCLSKDRTQRYNSADALATDLRRYLAGEPVDARPPSTFYRFRAFARRNKIVLTTVGLVTAALVLGTAVSTWQALRATEAERLARDSLESERLARSDAETARQRAEVNFHRARQPVDRYYTLVSQSALLDQPGLEPLRRELLEAALEYHEQFFAERAGDPGVKAELAATHLRAADVCHLIDRNDEAIAHLKSGLRLVEELLVDPHSAPAVKEHLSGVHKAGRTLHGGTRPPSDPIDALETLQHGARLWERLVHAHPQAIGFRGDLAGFYVLTAHLQRTLGRRSDAVETYLRATEILEDLVQEQPQVADYRHDLSSCHEVVALLRLVADRASEAEQAFRRSLELREGLAADFPDRPAYRLELARAQRELASRLQQKHPSVAVANLEKALGLLSELVGTHPGIPAFEEELARVRMEFAGSLREQGRGEEAVRMSRQAVAAFERLAEQFPGTPHYRERLVMAYRDLHSLLVATGKRNEARDAYRRLLDVQQTLVADFGQTARYHEQLAWLLTICPHAELRDPEGSVSAARRAIEMETANGNHWKTLGAALYRAGDWRSAVESLNKSLELPPGAKDTNQFFLAMAHARLAGDLVLRPKARDNHRAQAREFFARAVEWMSSNRPGAEEVQQLRLEAEELLSGETSATNQTAAGK